MRPLSLGQIEAARELLISNATDLIDESNLLLKEKRYARSYTLAHIACEELSKIPMLVRAGTWVALGYRVDWKALDKRLKSHQAKVRQTAVLDFAHCAGTAADGDLVIRLEKGLTRLMALLNQTEHRGKYWGATVKESGSRLSRVPALNELKNLSFYVSYEGRGSRFVQPSEVIQQELAEAIHRDALARVAFYVEAEAITRGTLRQIRNDPAFRASLKKKCEPLAKMLSMQQRHRGS